MAITPGRSSNDALLSLIEEEDGDDNEVEERIEKVQRDAPKRAQVMNKTPKELINMKRQK